MNDKMRDIILKVRKAIGLEEFLFLLGMALLYRGLSVAFCHAIAQTVTGAVLVVFSMLIVFKAPHE